MKGSVDRKLRQQTSSNKTEYVENQHPRIPLKLYPKYTRKKYKYLKELYYIAGM